MKKLLTAVLFVLLSLPAFGQAVAKGDIISTSTDCGKTGSCVVLEFQNENTGAIGIDVAGTFTATLQFEVLVKGSTTWRSISVTPLSSTTTVTSATAAGAWRVSVGGLAKLRVRCSAFTSGTANVALQSASVSAGIGGGGGPGDASNGELLWDNAGTIDGISTATTDGTITTFKAGADFLLADPTDATKLAKFDVSNIATATTRTVNIPNANSTTIQSDTGASNQFLTAVSAQGVISKAQPAFSNLSGAATVAQLPAFQLDKQDDIAGADGNSADKTIYTYTLSSTGMPSGKCIRIIYGAQRSSGASNVTYRLFFGGTTLYATAAIGAGSALIRATVCNNAGSTTAQWSLADNPNGTTITHTNPAETVTSGTVVIKGTFNVASGTSAAGQGWSVEMIP